jgi:hypothetical protein
MKQPATTPAHTRAAAATASRAAAAHSGAAAPLGSPRLLAQRRSLDSVLHGAAALQRASLDEEEPLQGKGVPLQRVEEEELLQGQGLPVQLVEEEELLQGQQLALQRAALEEEEPLQGQGLPADLQSGVEQLSGMDMSDVRVHAGSSRPAEVGALAYAQGTDIHLAPGQEQHLPHEAWHLVQQKQGRVRATVQAAGVPINDNPVLEAEADRMGAQAQAAGQRRGPDRGAAG